jgi:hypothetical protein
MRAAGWTSAHLHVPGKPDGHPAHQLAPRREDRPYGQGEFLFGSGSDDGRVGMVIMAMHCRAHRLNGEADIRPHTFQKQYGLFDEGKVLDLADPTVERARAYVRRSLAPVAAFDLAYDDLNWHPGAEGITPVYVPEVVAGTTETRRVAVLNDELEGESLTLEWSCGDSRGSQELVIPLGTFETVDVELTWPMTSGPALLSLTVLKTGRTAYSSDDELQFLVVAGDPDRG